MSQFGFDPASFWAGQSQARPQSGGQYFLPGHTAIVRIENAQVKLTQKSQMAFVVNATVIRSTAEEMPTGDSRSFFQDFKYRESAMQNVNALLCAAWGFHPVSQWAEFLAAIGGEARLQGFTMAATGADNILRGKIIRVDTWQKPGKLFTHHEFTPATEDMPVGPIRPTIMQAAPQPQAPQAPPWGAPQPQAQPAPWGAPQPQAAPQAASQAPPWGAPQPAQPQAPPWGAPQPAQPQAAPQPQPQPQPQAPPWQHR